MKILKNIFSKKEPLVPFALSFLGSDIHSHIIPGIDDGAKNIEESLNLAKGLVDLGYSKVVTTPHIMSDFYRNDSNIIENGLVELNNVLKENNIDLNVEAAAEYYVDFDFRDKIEKERLLTFGDNFILIEFSFIQPPKKLKDALFALQTNGYRPVLAHPERYIYWHNDFKILEELKERDILFQLNILSLIGIYSKEVTKIAEKLIQNKMIDWLGTDLHNQFQLKELKKLALKPSVIESIKDLNLLNKTL